MKNITIILGNYKNGGVATRSTNLANEFSRQGYKVTLLACREIGEKTYIPLENGVSLVQLQAFYDENKDNPAVKKDEALRQRQLKNYKRARMLTKALKNVDRTLAEKVKGIRNKELRAYFVLHPEDVYIPFGLGNFEALYFATIDDDLKIIYAEKNAAELELPSGEEERNIVFSHMKKLSGAVLQTHDELKFYKPAQIKNAVVINNPIKANLPVAYDGERKKVVVNFCRINAQKNLPLLIEAFDLFHETHKDYTLEIFGNAVEESEEKMRDELKNILISQGKDKYIKILPPSAKVHEIVKDYSMFVSSSDYEGLSNSMIEAMAIGMPVICTDCLGGGAREMITDGENGLLVPVKDKVALAKAMSTLAEDEELSRKLSKNAEKTRSNLSVEKIASKWIEVIEKA